MNNSLPFHSSSTPLSIEAVKQLPRTAIAKEWHGSEISPPLLFSVAIDPKALWFLASRAAAPVCDRSLACGAFVEGLWEQELAEVFLCAAEGSRYLEVNISPSGAWWSCSFHGYRERDSSTALEGVEAWAEPLTSDSTRWEAGLKIPRASISSRISFGVQGGKSRGNVSGVVLSKSRPLYLTYGNLEAANPDFHLAGNFLELVES